MRDRDHLFLESLYSKILLENEEPKTSSLSTKDLYNFYYLFTLLSRKEISGEYGEFIAKEYMKRYKEKYLRLFKDLLYKQVLKYINRKRIDSEITMERLEKGKDSSKELYDMMKGTYRSDMVRRNDVWNLIGEYLVELDNATEINKIGFFIDRLNNCIHNTKELILSKFTNGYQLIQVFDNIHRAPSLNSYKQFVDKDLRELN
jgi:hypothetical protein